MMLRTRFAPSPTGYLHLGHIVSAMYVWGIARFLNAEIILRIEDHDASRAQKKFEEAILRDLDWLGFEPDLGVSSVDKSSVFRQSDCYSHYSTALHDLEEKKLIYTCFCSRQDIIKRGGVAEVEELKYDNFCREKFILHEKGRVRLITTKKKFAFQDGLLGKNLQAPAEQCGDFLLRDKENNWSYQMAVCVDDFKQNVNLIIRGEDILPSTGRQIYLGGLLGRKDPVQYFHHPLIYDDGGKKLSKRFFSEAISKLRTEHYSPGQLLRLAAEKAHLGTFTKPLQVRDLVDIFAGKLGA